MNISDSSESSRSEECIHCGLDFDFSMPQEIIAAATAGNLAVFAGAGISTEVPAVFPETIYGTVAAILEEDGDLSFPRIMQKFQDAHGRAKLIKLIKNKLDYVDSFPGSRTHARLFHAELATMPYITEIVTTNWDTYFEEECGATPFVTGEDVSLYDLPGRKVIKIHGSMSNLASIIATEDDYKRSLERLSSSAIGGLLRAILSTKTVVFIGYSLRDWNFQQIYQALIEDMGDFAPSAYLVSPVQDSTPVTKSLRIHSIRTSGVRFLRDLKDRVANDGMYSDDRIYDMVSRMRQELLEADDFAKSFSHKKYPSIIMCWMYHDGALDACFRITHMRRSGEYSNKHLLEHKLRSYIRMGDLANSEGRFEDEAYIEGYLNILFLIAGESEEYSEIYDEMPRYFLFGARNGMRSKAEFEESLEHSRRRAPRVRKYCREISERLPEDMVMEHNRMLRGAQSGFGVN